MARGVNKAILLGNLGDDPDVRFTAGGNAVCNLSVATSHGVKDKDSGEWEDVTEWHRVVVFGKSAEAAGQFCSKGSKVFIEGRIQTRKWQDRDGNDRWTTEIVANDIQFVGKGGGDSNQAPPAQESGGNEGLEDDIPF